MSRVSFEEVNRLADEYFIDEKDTALRMRIIEIMVSEIYEQIKRDNFKYNECGQEISTLGRKVDYDTYLNVLYKALGLNVGNKKDAGKYNPAKETSFTSFFINNLDYSQKNFKIKNARRASIKKGNGEYDPDSAKPAAFEDSEDEEDSEELVGAYTDEYVDCESNPMLITARYFSNMNKSGKCGPLVKGCYSYHLINFSRFRGVSFDSLNNYTDELFDPYDYDYIHKMTTYPKNVTKDFIGLSESDYSEYVYKNKLYNKNSNKYSSSGKETEVNELQRKTLGLFYGVTDSAVTQRFAKLNSELSEILLPLRND